MKHLQLFTIILLALTSFLACKSTQQASPQMVNPPANGFNADDSDAKAIEIADQVMEAMGGRNTWNATQMLSWTFFGNRKHIWDKKNKRCRIESPKDNLTILLDLSTQTGSVKKGGQIYTSQDSLDKYLAMGNRWWINDSYWLVMPFKLKDSGVTLKYNGTGTTEEGRSADILQMTFAKVGVTQDNKYLVYVDQESKLVTQWDFYTNFNDEKPRFQIPWNKYQEYEELLLSGGGNSISDLSIDQMDESAFTNF